MPQIKDALILAAGFGKRLLPITEHTPKAMVKIGDEILLDRLIAQLKKAGITKIYINTHHLSKIIESHIKQYYSDITILHEPEILETGASIRNLINTTGLCEVFAVNCDSWFFEPDPFSAFLKQWEARDADAMILLTKAIDRVGDFAVNDNLISRPQSPALLTHIWSGAYIIKQHLFERFSDIPKFSSRDVIFSEIEKASHKIYGFICDKPWIDIGSHEALKKANIQSMNS